MNNVPQHDSSYRPPPRTKPQATYQGPVMAPPQNVVAPAEPKKDLSFLQGCLAALCCCWLFEDCCCDPTAMCGT